MIRAMKTETKTKNKHTEKGIEYDAMLDRKVIISVSDE